MKLGEAIEVAGMWRLPISPHTHLLALIISLRVGGGDPLGWRTKISRCLRS